MSRRLFSDRSGHRWEVRPHAKGDWEFRPVPGNPEPIHRGEPPLHTSDPFELSEQELRSILADATPLERDEADGPAGKRDRPGGGLFGDYSPPERRSPFLDDRED